MPMPSGVSRKKSSSSYSKASARNAGGGNPFDNDFGVSSRDTSEFRASASVARTMAMLGKNLSLLVKDQEYASRIIESTRKKQEIKDKQEKETKKGIEEYLKALTEVSKKTKVKEEDLFKTSKSGTGKLFDSLPPDIKKLFIENKGLTLEALRGFQTSIEKKQDEEKKKNDDIVKKRDDSIKTFFTQQLEKIDKFIEKNETLMRNTILGPWSLMVAPFEDFFKSSLYTGIKSVGGKLIKKRNPKENDLIKNKELGPLFLWNKLKKHFSDEDKEKNKMKLGDLLTKIPAGLLGTILKGGAIAAIAAGLIWATIDGIKGAALSGKWGVDKVSGFIGGFLGGTESGFKGAAKNAGKWALMGVGIGFLAAGPVGAIIGLLLGAAIGAVLGYIGGKQIAKGFADIKQKLHDAWFSKEFEDKILGIPYILMEGFLTGLTTFYSTIPVMIANIFTKDPKVLAKVKFWSKGIFDLIAQLSPFGFIKNWFGDMLGSIKKFRKDKGKKSMISRIMELAFNLFTSPLQSLLKTIKNSNILKEVFPKIVNFLGDMLISISKGLSSAGSWLLGIGEKVVSFIGDMLGNALLWLAGAPKNIPELIGKIINFAGEALSTALAWLKAAGSKVVDLAGEVKKFFTNVFTAGYTKVTEFFKTNTLDSLIQEYLIDPVLSFFSMIGDVFNFLGSMNPLKLIEMTGHVLKGDTTFGKEMAKFKIGELSKDPKAKEKMIKMYGTEAAAAGQAFANPEMFLDNFKSSKVNDGIITSKGQVIHTNPKDTIIATKNTLSHSPASGGSGSSGMEQKLDTMIALLQKILAKDITLQMPNQTRADLDLLVKGLVL
jgi:hypothetical protein